MPRHKNFGLALIAVLFTATLIAVPAFAEEPAVPAAAPEAASPSDHPGCGETVDLAAMLGKAEICPAEVPQNSVPELKVGRTCRCSCGQPCKKDADCGPGGLCTAGITCC